MHKERSAKTLYVDIDDEVNALHTIIIKKKQGGQK